MSHTNLKTYEKLSAENEMELRQILSRYISKSYASYRGTDHPTGEVIWWINQKLADARREVIEKVKQNIPRYLKGGELRNQYFVKGYNECRKDVLATLREEGTK